MKTIFLTTVAALSLGLSACAQAGPNEPANKAEIEEIVRAYILENPEIIREAMIALQEKEMADEQRLNRESLLAAKDALRNDPRDYAIGPKDAKVTIVEFFDYNCGYCKRATPWVEDLIKTQGDDVRVIFKELPILDERSRTSRMASRAALAAARQGKYLDMHLKLMEEKRLTADIIQKLAKDIGLDVKQFNTDMTDVSVEQHIDDTLLLANRLPALTGTPFFVINDDYVSGADTDRMQRLVDAALEG